MNRKTLEDKFLDYIEGRLNSSEQRDFETKIAEDSELKSSLEQYRQVIEMERLLAAESHELHPNFSVKVMEQIDESAPGFFRRIIMEVSSKQIKLARSVGALAVLTLCISLVWQSSFERQNIPEPSSLSHEDGRTVATSGETKIVGRSSKVDQKTETSSTVLNEEKEVAGVGTLHNDIITPKAKSSDQSEGSQGMRIDTLRGAEVARRIKSAQTADLGVSPQFGAGAQSLRQAPQVLKADPNEIRQGSIGGAMLEKGVALNSQAAKQPIPAPGVSVDEDVSRTRRIVAPIDRVIIPENRERYREWQENERIAVATQPVSTFSIDVDTGSYTNVRRFLNSGMLPPKDAVRIEEFINYFDYSYPAQSEDAFGVNYEIAPSPLEPERYLLKVGVKARDLSALEESKPWNLVFLVDVSGSMMPQNKLPLVQAALKLLVNRMRPNDRIALVTYAGRAGIALESTGADQKQKILSAIDSLSAGGSTAGSAGITMAYQIAKQNFSEKSVNRVILATDGDFNVGTTSFAALLRQIEDERRSGVTLTTIGVGTGNINEAMMEQVANKGNGNYFYVDSFKEARKVFERDLTGTIEIVAKDVKLQIEFNPENVVEYRLIGYENRKLRNEDFSNDKIDAGEIGSGHTVTALYELVLAGTPEAKRLATQLRYQKQADAQPVKELSDELGFLQVRFKQPNGSKSVLRKFPIRTSVVKQSAAEASDDFRFAAAVSYFGHLLRASKFSGDYDLNGVEKLAEGALGKDKHGYRREFVELVKNAKSLSAGN